jgi:hypothetical protein
MLTLISSNLSKQAISMIAIKRRLNPIGEIPDFPNTTTIILDCGVLNRVVVLYLKTDAYKKTRRLRVFYCLEFV